MNTVTDLKSRDTVRAAGKLPAPQFGHKCTSTCPHNITKTIAGLERTANYVLNYCS